MSKLWAREADQPDQLWANLQVQNKKFLKEEWGMDMYGPKSVI